MENKSEYKKNYSWMEFLRVFSIVVFGGLGLIIILTSESRIWQIIIGLMLLGLGIALLTLEKR